PALDHALIVMGRYIEMHEIYSSVCSVRGEGEDQGRIRITVVKSGRASGLDHKPLRDDLEHRAGERVIEGSEWRTRLGADRDRRTRDRRMLCRISVHREETFGWGREDDRLGNDASHGTLARILNPETPGNGQRSRAASAPCVKASMGAAEAWEYFRFCTPRASHKGPRCKWDQQFESALLQRRVIHPITLKISRPDDVETATLRWP